MQSNLDFIICGLFVFTKIMPKVQLPTIDLMGKDLKSDQVVLENWLGTDLAYSF